MTCVILTVVNLQYKGPCDVSERNFNMLIGIVFACSGRVGLIGNGLVGTRVSLEGN